MAGERGGSRLAIGAGDGDEPRAGARDLADEDLGVADDLDPGGMRPVDAPMGARMGQGNAGRQHQGGECGEIGLREIAQRNPGSGRLPAGLLAIVPRSDLGTARLEGLGAGQSRAGQPEHRDPSALEPGGGEHGARHRSLRVDKPTSARTTAMIQNLITMVGSLHPFCSK